MRDILIPLIVLATAIVPATAIELDSDRPGRDYRNFEIAETNPGPCAAACAQESQCRAWTYVKPGVQGPRARCWLKAAVPQAYTSRCCISDIKGDDPETEEAREVQSILATLGYDPGPVDGKPGRKTRDAISRFQAEHRLAADGRISPELIKGLWAVASTRDMAKPDAGSEFGRTGTPPSTPAASPAPVAAPSPPAEDLSGLSTLD